MEPNITNSPDARITIPKPDIIAISNFPDKYKASYNKAIEFSKNRIVQTAIKLLELIIKRTDLDKKDKTITEKEAAEITDFLNRQIENLKLQKDPFIYGLDYKKTEVLKSVPEFITEVLFRYSNAYNQAIKLLKDRQPEKSIAALNNIISKLEGANNTNILLALRYLEEQKQTLGNINGDCYMLTLEGKKVTNPTYLEKMEDKIKQEAANIRSQALATVSPSISSTKGRRRLWGKLYPKKEASPSIWNLKKLKERFTSSTTKLKKFGVNMTDRYSKVQLETKVKMSLYALGGFATLLSAIWIGGSLHTDLKKKNIPKTVSAAALPTTEQTPLLQEDAPETAPHFYTTKAGDGLEKIFKRESKSLQDLSPAAKINAISRSMLYIAYSGQRKAKTGSRLKVYLSYNSQTVSQICLNLLILTRST